MQILSDNTKLSSSLTPIFKAAILSISIIAAGLNITPIKAQSPNEGTQKTAASESQNATSKNDQLGAVKKEAEDIQRKIKKRRTDIERYSHTEAEVVGQLNQVEKKLNTVKKRAAALKTEIDDLDKKIERIAVISKDLQNRIKANEKYVSQRLVVLYKLNQLGAAPLLASADSIYDFFERKTALGHILTYDERVCNKLIDDQAELKSVSAQLESHKSRKRAGMAEYQTQIKQVSQQRSKRQKLLSRVRGQKNLQLAALDALNQSALQLDQKISSLQSERNPGPVINQGPSQPFSAHKGLLIMPVSGKIINLFGPYKNSEFKVVNFRSGIDIQSERGEPVRAVYAGRILYSEWFKGYGNMIIIDHGHNYYTLYAHVEEMFKSKGETAATGEVIATVGETGSMIGPKLYFEVRHHGKPMDPLAWLKQS